MPSVDNLQQNSNQLHQKYQPPSHVPNTFTWSSWGNHICIAGSFDPPNPVWSPIEMNKITDNVSEVTLDLVPNKKYFYKFVIDGQWVLNPDIPSYPDESGNYNHVIEVEPPPPPPLPSEEEKLIIEDQKDDDEQKVEIIESEIQNQVVNEDQELNQNVEEQVEVVDIQKDHLQLEENQIQLQQEEKQILSDIQIEQNQHEESQVSINNDQKEHYQHFDDQVTATADDQKEQHDDQFEEVSEKTEQFVDEVHVESDVTEKITESSTESFEAVQIEQSHDNSLITEAPEIETIFSASITKETIIESDNEKLSAEHVANNESIEQTSDIVIDEEIPKETQYTSSTSHDDSMNPVTVTEKEINISGEVTSEQTKEEMVSSNQDEGITSITTITQETHDSETSDVNVEGLSKLSNEVKVQEDIIVQSVVKDDSIYEFTEQSVIKDDSINEFTEQSVVVEDDSKQSVVEDDSINEFTEQSAIKNDSINEFTEQSVVVEDDSINEFTEQSAIKDDSINEFTEQSDVKDDSKQSVVKDDSINEFTEQSVVVEDDSKKSVVEDDLINEFTEQSAIKDDSINEFTEQSVIEDNSKQSVVEDDSINESTEQSVVVKDGSKQSVVEDDSINESTEQSVVVKDDSKQSVVEDDLINEFTEQSTIEDDSKQSVVEDGSINEFTEQSAIKENSINESTEQSVVVEESKVTELIENKSPSIDEKREQDVTTKDILTPSSVKVSDSTTNVDSELEFETYSTDAIMPSSDVNYEETYEPELDSINENEDYEDDDENDYDEDGDYNKDDNVYSSYDDMFKGETYPEGVSQEAIKEVILNHTWAKDDSIDETIPSTWLESFESTAYVWSEKTQAEWSNQDTWTLGEENTGTPKSEHVIEEIYSSNEVIKSHEIPSTSLVEETVTKQAGIPSSTNVKESLESTLVREIPAQSTIYSNESHIEDKTREITVKENDEEKANEYDIMTGEKLVIKENIISTSEVKVIAEPSSVQYEKPESSATAGEKVSSMPTTVIAPANAQDMINADLLKEKLNLIEKQENFEESLTGVNIPAGKISQRKISPISPNASSPGESTRNADMYTHNITVATNTSREIVSPTKESLSIKSKSKKKPPIEITSREVLQKDLKSAMQHEDLDKLDFNILYLVTSVATTFTLGIISMLFRSVFGTKRNK